MKAINLFVDFEFTSLSPDAQPISVGIVSEEYFNEQYRQLYTDKVEIKKGNCSIDHLTTKSFYAEFSDFDINRCDEWVRENVVGKLEMRDGYKMGKRISETNPHQTNVLYGTTDNIKKGLYFWLSQFSDYQITFVVDCGCYDWYHLLQLIGEWEEKKREVRDGDEIYDITSEKGILISSMGDYELIVTTKTGLPKLPSNISPVPFELNQFIADKKGISVREAFDLNREDLLIEDVVGMVVSEKSTLYGEPMQKHNALWDAKVMKAIYEKLK
jgi:hypothetical protein